jgi:uncharacterized RDD family membrane protein YckC
MSEKTVETASPKTAGFFSRMVAFLLDIFLLTVVGLVSGVVIFLILHFFRIGQILDFLRTQLGIDNLVGQYVALINPALFLIVLVYFVFFWTFLGQTPGKALLGLRIVRRDGRRLSVWRSFVRYVAYWVSAIPLFLGFIWILFDRRHEGWHDKIAGTNVIYIIHQPPAVNKEL